MGFLSWFNTEEESQFGLLLAKEIGEKIPPSLKIDQLTSKHQQVIVKLMKQAEHFKTTHSLNIYKKAKLGNTFKWKMLEMGYDKEWVDQLTHQLLVHL
jgi:hypothetical protein